MFRTFCRASALVVFLFAAACGTPAPAAEVGQAVLVLPSRVPIQPTAGGLATTIPPTAVALQVTNAPVTSAPALQRPRLTATITLIPSKGPPTATSSAPIATATPDPAAGRGEILFQNGTGEEGVATCASCHYVDSEIPFTGPGQKGVARRAGRRGPGQDAATYIRTSIINPNAFLVPNEKGPDGVDHIYAAGGQSLMYQMYAQKLSADQINDLVAYMLTLR